MTPNAEIPGFDIKKLESLRKAIRSESLDGWLFCNFRHRDKLSDEILNIPGASNSRYWFYAVPAEGEPLKIIHSVEPNSLDTLPGKQIFYVSRDDLKKALQPLAGKTWGVHSSEELPAISYLDAGTAASLKNAGLRLVSAGALIQRVYGLLDSAGIASHEKAAVHLYQIVEAAWEQVTKSFRDGKAIYEGDIRQFMSAEMEKRGVISEGDLIVAAGPNTGNPHYNFTGRGAAFKNSDVIQFDLWAKEKHRDAIFADISWAGVYSATVPEEAAKRFAALTGAREAAIRFIQDELSKGRSPKGAEVDIKAREVIISSGYGEGLKHRTGHGIDREIHGSGVNMDSVEFPDSRLILDGSCFSIEPGVYFGDFGMRTEIDVYVCNGKAHVSGGLYKRQYNLLHCGQH